MTGRAHSEPPSSLECDAYFPAIGRPLVPAFPTARYGISLLRPGSETCQGPVVHRKSLNCRHYISRRAETSRRAYYSARWRAKAIFRGPAKAVCDHGHRCIGHTQELRSMPGRPGGDLLQRSIAGVAGGHRARRLAMTAGFRDILRDYSRPVPPWRRSWYVNFSELVQAARIYP